MSHEDIDVSGDSFFSQLQSYCLGLPEAHERWSFGHPWFKAGKRVFAIYGGSTLAVKTDFLKREIMVDSDERYYPTPYMHQHGYMTVDLRAEPELPWEEIADLVLESYRMVALKRMLKALDD